MYCDIYALKRLVAAVQISPDWHFTIALVEKFLELASRLTKAKQNEMNRNETKEQRNAEQRNVTVVL